MFGTCCVHCANDLALLSLNESDLQYVLDQFFDACLETGMKISSAKTEIMGLSKHPVQRSFRKNGVILQQIKKFKYLRVTFSSDGRQDNKLDTRIGKASAVMCQLCQLVILKRELCAKAKLSVFRSVFVPILNYGHECWVITKRVRS